MNEEKVYLVGGDTTAKEAIAKTFADQGKTTVFVDEANEVMKKEIASELTKQQNFVQSIEPIKKLKACKGRHTYINKGNGLWKCNCGKQLL